MPAAVLIVGLVIVVAVLTTMGRAGRAQESLTQWAAAQGLELLGMQRRLVFRGPFSFRTSKYQEVYEITVRDGDGKVRHGFVRIGGWFSGMTSDSVEAHWD